MAAESATRNVPPSGVFGVADGVAEGGAVEGSTTDDGLGVGSGVVPWHAARTTAATTTCASDLIRDSHTTLGGRTVHTLRPVHTIAIALAALIAASCASSPSPRSERTRRAASHDMATTADRAMDRVSMGPCEPSMPPLGAIPPGPPAWCLPLGPGVSTARSTASSWVDSFDSRVDHTAFPTSYRVFEAARPSSTVTLTRHFLHNGHWMVDVAGTGAPPDEYEGDRRDAIVGTHWGGGLVRPDRTFRFVDGTLAVEFDVAAGMLAYHDGWPELVVTTASAPTGVDVDPTHAIGVFGGAPSVGVRLYTDRTALSSAYGRSGRIYELSSERSEGATASVGGSPSTPALAAAWRLCAPLDPDARCRDRFRVEFTADSMKLWANGTLYFAVSGLPAERQLPAELIDGDVYVYFASWVYLGQAATERFHWGRIAINP
jgi:hypothetical protein